MTQVTQDRGQRARRTIEAFGRRDWATFREVFAPELVYTETGTGRRIEGLETFIDTSEEWLAVLPDCTGEVTRLVHDRDTTVLEVVWRGTHTGPLDTPTGTVPPSGATVEIRATVWQTWAGDEVVAYDHHLDVLTMLAQIGALGAPASA